MKKFFVAAAVALVCLSCFSCKKKAADKLTEVKKKGTLTIATSPDFPPFEFIDDNKNVTGIEMELIRKIAADMKLKVEIQNVEFDSIIPGVKSGKFDMGVSGFSITEERKKNVLFSDPYALAGQVVVVLEGSPVKTVADLAGKTISVQSGTTADVYCQEAGYDVKAFSSNTEAEMAMANGKVDVWVIDDSVGREMVAKYNKANSKKLHILDELLTYEEYAFITDLGNGSLMDEMDKRIAKYKADGTMEKLFADFGMVYINPETQK